MNWLKKFVRAIRDETARREAVDMDKVRARRERIIEALKHASSQGRTGWQLARDLSPRIRRATLYRDLSRMSLDGEIPRVLVPRDPTEGWPGPPRQVFYANEFAPSASPTAS